MRDAKAGTDARRTLRVVEDLRGFSLAAVAYGENDRGCALLRLNPTFMAGRSRASIVLWADLQIASGRRAAWLRVADLSGLI